MSKQDVIAIMVCTLMANGSYDKFSKPIPVAVEDAEKIYEATCACRVTPADIPR